MKPVGHLTGNPNNLLEAGAQVRPESSIELAQMLCRNTEPTKNMASACAPG